MIVIVVAVVLAAVGLAARASPLSKCSSRMNGHLPSFTPADFSFSGNVRRYYVAAVEEEWDYAPTGYDNIRGVPLNQSNQGMQYLPSKTSLGTKYIKGLYRAFTDATFTQRSTQPQWLGYQGPVMRAEVGDMIEILLYNKFSNDSVSMHSMGLFYDKVSEGSDYYNTTLNGTAAFSKGEAIPPGECYVYKWLVPQTSAPLPSQPSKLWTYHGDINLEQDVDTGLIGPVITYQRGQMNHTVTTTREFVLFYASTMESDSVFYGRSVERFLPSKFKPSPGPSVTPSSRANESIWAPIDLDEPNSAIKPSLAQAPTHINGYLYANLPGLDMCLLDDVIWYLYTFGVFSDGFHVFHPHGNNVQLTSGEYVASVNLLPSTMTTVSMTAYNPGIWDVICHNGDHYEQGMEATYRVHMKGIRFGNGFQIIQQRTRDLAQSQSAFTSNT